HEIPLEHWMNRDDGIITLSHAKNLVEYGFVGVSPSGERVEGFSSPLQFVVFAVVYAATHVGYASFIAAQTTFGWLAVGALSYAILWQVTRHRVLSMIGSVSVALLLSRLPTFVEWSGSGLENPLTHASYLLVFVAILHLADHERPALRWAPLFVVAAFARFESIVHVAPLVVVFAVAHAKRYRNLHAVRLLGAFGVGWLALFLFRAWYFHDLVPNTAHAQGIAPAVAAARALGGDMSRATAEHAFAAVRSNGGQLLLLAIPAVAFTRMRAQLRELVLFGSLVMLVVCAHMIVFGEARLDPPRTTTFLAPISALMLVGALLQLPMPSWACAILPAFLTLAPAAPMTTYGEPYVLCCQARDFETFHELATKLRTRHRLPRPLLASPDLGAVSFAKEFNMLDLGLLGSTLFAHTIDTRVRAEIVLRVLRPDIVSINGSWQDFYRYLLSDPRFSAQYQPEDGAWTRKDVKLGADTRERRLIDELAPQPTPAPIEKAIGDCNASSESDPCLYVVRAAYRFRPDFSRAQRGQVRQHLAAIHDAAQRALALAIFDGPDGARVDLAMNTFLGR
ncbi:MAG: hypothetical protein ACHREM_28890, partial [Polyangiales bacterium]